MTLAQKYWGMKGKNYAKKYLNKSTGFLSWGGEAVEA
jgi:hypothetical protein